MTEINRNTSTETVNIFLEEKRKVRNSLFSIASATPYMGTEQTPI